MGFTLGLILLIVLAGFRMGTYARMYVPAKLFKSLVILLLAVNSVKMVFEYFIV